MTQELNEQLEKVLSEITYKATQYEIYNGKSYHTYSIGSRFRIEGEDKCASYAALKTSIDSPSISLYRLVGGCNNIEAFKVEGTEFSDDFYEVCKNTPSRVLSLPLDYGQAIKILLDNYRGKVLRIIARSALGTAAYKDRMYLFAIED